MKYIRKAIFALGIGIFTVLSAFSAFAALKQTGNFKYAIENYATEKGEERLGACIYYCVATDSNATLEIPDAIDGYPVLELAYGTVEDVGFFKNSNVRNNIKEISIPESVEIINGTFNGCKNLETVNFDGNKLKQIGSRSFAACNELKSIDLPESVEEIRYAAFASCSSLEEFIIPKSAVSLGREPGNAIKLIVSGNNLRRVVNLSTNDFPLEIASAQNQIWYYDEEGTIKAELIPSGATVYRIKTPERVLKYLETIEPKLETLEKSGLSMSIANDADTFREYIMSYVGEYNRDDFKQILSTTPYDPDKPRSFIPAKVGSKSNPLGKEGFGSITLKITAVDNEREVYYQKMFSIKIKPIPYEGKEDSSESSESDYTDPGAPVKKLGDVIRESKGLRLNNFPLYSGEWVASDGKWRLKIGDTSFATSQWARINDKWYLFGSDSDMMTGWQMIDGKWYYLEPTGEMATGWRFLNGKWYYMDKSGIMLVDTVTPDGYKVNEDGEWLQ